jgi:hypothetical protein
MKTIRIFSKIFGDIRHSSCTTGIIDTCGTSKFATGVIVTGSKISTGINDTGGKQWEHLSNC